MKKIIKNVDEKRGIVQVTIADERWYFKPSTNESGVPEFKAVPSVTWICGSYPKGIQFYKWLADKGWDEAEAIKSAAGDKGSKVHQAIDDIFSGKEVRMDSKFLNKSTGQEEELTLEECDCILSFKAWFDEVKPEPIAWEHVVFSDKYNYAGTIDLICLINGEPWIIDFKTSQYVWPEYELQVSSYRQTVANGENEILHKGKQIDVSGLKTGILQVGYKRNKNGYKFTEIENKFNLFLATRDIWESEHDGEEPSKKDYPIILSAAKVEEVKEETPDLPEIEETVEPKIKKTKTK
jgi:hypothetical protein